MTKFLARIVAWITAGYPEGVPGPDRVPLFSLLRRRLTEDEVRTVAVELKRNGDAEYPTGVREHQPRGTGRTTHTNQADAKFNNL